MAVLTQDSRGAKPQSQASNFGRPTSLGPVADLERHLPTDWWRTLFNSLYLQTDADVVENSANTKTEIDTFLELTGLDTQDSILDLCCGQGRHLLELSSRGYAFLSGVDRSRYLIRLAKKRAQKSGSSIRFSEGDARKLRLTSSQFSCVSIMGNSFGYFDKELDDLNVLREVHRLLKPDGIVYLDITNGSWMRQHFAPRSWEWINQQALVCRERSLSSDSSRLISREVVVDVNKGVIADQFYAERLFTEQDLISLLKEAGFEAAQINGELKASSTREEGGDLGMMGNRLIVTARAHKPAAVAVQGKQKVQECLVLLGDPRLPDKVKKNGVFNAEDLVVIERLKAALGSLGGYKFHYLDQHSTLITKLQNHRPAMVLNLCDEGFLNEATQESHIVALLEMLNIPYTGAGPGCLTLCYDKSIVAGIAQSLEVPVPAEIWIDPSNQSVSIPLEFPTFVKPAKGDSSIGITQQAVVHNAEQLVEYVGWLNETLPSVPVLIQEYLSGREFSVGLIGNGADLQALPILEVDYSDLPDNLPKILGYESKWLPDSPYWNKMRYHEANLREEEARTLIDNAILLFNRLGCRDYARFDFRAGQDGTIKLLEANPNPGWCWDGKLNMMAEWAGWSYAELLHKILQAAQARYE